MNVSVGKFFRKLIGRKQNAPQKVGKVTKVESEKATPSDAATWKSGSIESHNNEQKRIAKRTAKNRKRNSLARKQRKLNVKGGKR